MGFCQIYNQVVFISFYYTDQDMSSALDDAGFLEIGFAQG